VPSESVILASSAAFGARIAADKLKAPLATIHISAFMFRSAIRPPVFPFATVPSWLPPAVVRGFYWFADRFVADRMLAPTVNGFRAEIGLPPLRRITGQWYYSSDIVLGLFPDWYNPPQ